MLIILPLRITEMDAARTIAVIMIIMLKPLQPIAPRRLLSKFVLTIPIGSSIDPSVMMRPMPGMAKSAIGAPAPVMHASMCGSGTLLDLVKDRTTVTAIVTIMAIQRPTVTRLLLL